MSTDSAGDDTTDVFMHWCESCGHEDLLTSRDAYEAGWDFPPRMGSWGVISPRTCPSCTIKNTVWWSMAIDKLRLDEMTPQQRKVVGRILDEVPPGTGGVMNWGERDGA